MRHQRTRTTDKAASRHVTAASLREAGGLPRLPARRPYRAMVGTARRLVFLAVRSDGTLVTSRPRVVRRAEDYQTVYAALWERLSATDPV